jgi:hypothetical protein
MPPTIEKKKGPTQNLEQFLEVEFLHSLGCYGDAKASGEEFDFDGIWDGEGALERTKDLNCLLDALRDDPGEPVRHPDPSLGPKGEKDEDGNGLLLGTQKCRDRLRRITDFYSTGITALDDLLEASQTGREDAAEPLERLGTCLFWDREPASSNRQVNMEFWVRLDDEQTDEEDRWKTPLSEGERRRIEGKRARFQERRKAVESALKPQLTYRGEWSPARADDHAKALLAMDLRKTGSTEDCVTPGFVIQCLVAAHLRMHAVEHFLSLPFEEAMTMSSVNVEETLQKLQEAEALNTFVYVVSRSMPWLFATAGGQRQEVFDICRDGFGAGKDQPADDDAPENGRRVFSAFWRSQRLALLALHRRAFGHSLRDALDKEAFNDSAFKDFHKLQRLLRVQRRSLDERKDDGNERIRPLDFVAGLDALAETHIGDLYRSDHAHPVALKHFCDAVDRLDHLSKDLLKRDKEKRSGDRSTREEEAIFGALEEGPHKVACYLQDSRWRVHLMMSKGKGFYEAGNLKRSVKWLLKSWGAFLVLLHHERGGLHQTTGSGDGRKLTEPKLVERFEHIDEAVRRLSVIKNDPDFSKPDLARLLEPIVEEAQETEIPESLRVIGSEILLRLGHVLFVLRLDAKDGKEEHRLAEACLDRARELDDSSILVLADQLKIKHRRAHQMKPDEIFSPERQWPYGRGNPEQLIRVIEYDLLRWLATKKKEPSSGSEEAIAGSKPESPVTKRGQDRRVARELISGLLTHTDSINVRQAQVHRYLMQPKRPARSISPAESWQVSGSALRDDASEEPAIEFICLRRYSSFFPFVPRPSAFRSLGGGYLLRLHHKDRNCDAPFGVAVDPGPDFIDNLYRCGFGLGDVNMVILTHDHPDHSVDLAPILSLMGYRMKHGDDTFKPPVRGNPDSPVRRLLIVGNESVARQLRFFNKPHRSEIGADDPKRPDALQIVSFDEFEGFFRETMARRERDELPEVAIPEQLRLKPVVSIRHSDGYGMLAYGFRLSLGEDGPSIGFTGDTGGFLLKKEDEDSETPWEIEPNDPHRTMALCGHQTWREHWAPVLDSDVLIPHVSGLPLSQLLVLANDGLPKIDWGRDKKGKERSDDLRRFWEGLEEAIRQQVTFAFWLPEKDGAVSLPLEPIEAGTRWPKGHLYLIGLLEFARAYKEERERLDRPGLLLVGELREELGSLRGKIANALNDEIFEASAMERSGSYEDEDGCRALTTDVGLRLMIKRPNGKTQVSVLCSTCDLDNDRTRLERFHSPQEIREVNVKGENEGMFYNCSNHDPSRQTDPVFIERVERYDVFSANPNP